MKQIKIRRFDFDRSLGYLIQNVTGDSTQEILGYFYGITKFVVDELSRTSKAAYLNRDIVLFYKDTAITYRIRIGGTGPGYWHGYADSAPAVCINITYPSDKDTYDISALMDAIVESGLGLTDENNMPQFERPLLKTPRCLSTIKEEQNRERNKAQSST